MSKRAIPFSSRCPTGRRVGARSTRDQRTAFERLKSQAARIKRGASKLLSHGWGVVGPSKLREKLR